MASVDSTRMMALDGVVIGASVLAGVASFLPWYRVRVSVLDIERSADANAWNAGFGAWFSVVLLLPAGPWCWLASWVCDYQLRDR